MIILALTIILVICLFVVGYIIYKRLPDLRNLDVSSLSSQKQDETKSKMIQAKLWRDSEKLRNVFSKATGSLGVALKGNWVNLKDKVLAWEADYQAKHHKKESKPLTLDELFSQAEKMLDEKNSVEAEKVLIEIISKDKENILAYKMLGDLYLEDKSYDQAEEIFKYLIKLTTAKDNKGSKQEEAEVDYLSSLDVDPKLAGYYDDLAQIYELTDKPEKALDSYLRASSIEPNNPKYLDKVIDLGVKMKDKGLASKTFRRLREINPENAKLDEFKEAIEKM